MHSQSMSDACDDGRLSFGYSTIHVPILQYHTDPGLCPVPCHLSSCASFLPPCFFIITIPVTVDIARLDRKQQPLVATLYLY